MYCCSLGCGLLHYLAGRNTTTSSAYSPQIETKQVKNTEQMWQMSSLSCLDGGKSSVVSPAFKSHADVPLTQDFQWQTFFFSSYLEWATYLNKRQVIHRTLDGIGVIVLQMFTRQSPFFFASPPNSQSLGKRKGSCTWVHMWATDVPSFERVFFFFFHLQVRVQSTQILGQI